jgi:hypothetical protein
MTIPYDVDLPLFSLHIAKTGGTTLYTLLPLWFPPGHILYHYPRRNGLPPRKYDAGAGDIVHGHFVNGNDTDLFKIYPDAKQCIAFVRDPFDRLVSHYFQDKHEAKMWGREPTFPTFEILYETTVAHIQLAPVMSGLNFLPRHFTLENFRSEIDRLFVHLGLYESFSESLAFLERKLSNAKVDYDSVSFMPALRSAERDEMINPELRERYEAEPAFELERKIWDYAKQLHAADREAQL